MIGMTNMVSKNSVSGGAFRVNNCSYYADENMTWENWINSKYNIGVADSTSYKFFIGTDYDGKRYAAQTTNYKDVIISDTNGNRQLATNIIVVGSNYEATSVAPWT